MHGVGYQFFAEAFKKFGFQGCIAVTEQIEPDPEFPTVKYPNPEEGKSALDLAMRTADANGSTVILANDPDADRLALAEKQPDGRWQVLTGNEIGSTVGWWLIKRYLEANAGGASDAYCLASTVSSRLLKAIAEKEGVNYVETLTGFKWMGNKACELMKNGKTVLFAFEEAIGFMCGTNVLDKDGISAAVIAAEMTAHLAREGTTVLQHLGRLHDIYGYHVSKNSYFICYDPETIKHIFERLRNYDGPGKYPSAIGPYRIRSVRDLTTGFDSSQPDGKAILPTSKSSQMITFMLENSCIVTMRTSGTEPKIKYYTEYCSRPEMGLDRATVDAELNDVVKHLEENFFEPEKNRLIARDA
jgi:phosphoglucomutase/phosphopentomutase